jgi:uncharacterized membrane protein
VACMTARGGKGLKKGFLAAQCVWRRHFKSEPSINNTSLTINY